MRTSYSISPPHVHITEPCISNSVLKYSSGDRCGRPIDLGSAKTVGQRGRHARISLKARTVVRVNQTRITQGREQAVSYPRI